MQTQHIQDLLSQAFADCEVSVSGEGNHLDVVVIGEVFEGLRPVKKQQMVYAVLNDLIADGTIHAVNIRALTPAQFADQ